MGKNPENYVYFPWQPRPDAIAYFRAALRLLYDIRKQPEFVNGGCFSRNSLHDNKVRQGDSRRFYQGKLNYPEFPDSSNLHFRLTGQCNICDSLSKPNPGNHFPDVGKMVCNYHLPDATKVTYT